MNDEEEYARWSTQAALGPPWHESTTTHILFAVLDADEVAMALSLSACSALFFAKDNAHGCVNERAVAAQMRSRCCTHEVSQPHSHRDSRAAEPNSLGKTGQ